MLRLLFSMRQVGTIHRSDVLVLLESVCQKQPKHGKCCKNELLDEIMVYQIYFLFNYINHMTIIHALNIFQRVPLLIQDINNSFLEKKSLKSEDPCCGGIILESVDCFLPNVCVSVPFHDISEANLE